MKFDYEFVTGSIDGFELSISELRRIRNCINAMVGIEDVEEFMYSVKHFVAQTNDCECHICTKLHSMVLFPHKETK